jgi:hypothetical protein
MFSGVINGRTSALSKRMDSSFFRGMGFKLHQYARPSERFAPEPGDQLS